MRYIPKKKIGERLIMISIDDKPCYKWQDVPEGLYTKTVLKNENGLKPINEDNPDAFMKSYIQGKWRTYNLYHIGNCKMIKKRSTDISGFSLDEKTIAAAMYVINKSAKKVEIQRKLITTEESTALFKERKVVQLSCMN